MSSGSLRTRVPSSISVTGRGNLHFLCGSTARNLLAVLEANPGTCSPVGALSRRPSEVGGVGDRVGVALLGEEALTVLGELRVYGVAGDDRVDPRRPPVLLRTEQPAQPLGLFLP